MSGPKKIKSAAYQPGFDALKLDGLKLEDLDLSNFSAEDLALVGLDLSMIQATESDRTDRTSTSESSNMPPGTLTVESVALYIKSCLEEDTNLQRIWVLGEISSVNRSGKGTYFTLQDPESRQAIACVIWNSTATKLQAQPQQGEQVLVLASIKTYSLQSRYQLQVIQIRAAGEGLQALRYQQLRDRLYEEGIFDPDIKKILPRHPQTIAVVTSPNAAAWGDIQTTLIQRYPGLKVLLSPATVQGETAPSSIVKAIDRVQADGRAEVLILARGGGAVEDLACFNDERVVRAIAACSIPVISGIGHDRDQSLADLAADYAAHTPTAAAETVVPDLQTLLEQHRHRILMIEDTINVVLDRHQNQLNQLQRRLQLIRPDRQLDQAQERLHWLREKLIQTMRSRLTECQSTHNRLQTKLIALDPHAVLVRGYAVVRSELADLSDAEAQSVNSELTNSTIVNTQVNTQVVRSVRELTIGQTVELQLGEGTATAQITAIQNSTLSQNRSLKK